MEEYTLAGALSPTVTLQCTVLQVTVQVKLCKEGQYGGISNPQVQSLKLFSVCFLNLIKFSLRNFYAFSPALPFKNRLLVQEVCAY